MKVSLGDTCNNSIWGERLIPRLKIDYFNLECQNEELWNEELKQRAICDFCLYVITPGVYSIAKVVDDYNKRPKKTILCILENEDFKFDAWQMKSLKAARNMILRNKRTVFYNLDDLVEYLNSFGRPAL